MENLKDLIKGKQIDPDYDFKDEDYVCVLTEGEDELAQISYQEGLYAFVLIYIDKETGIPKMENEQIKIDFLYEVGLECLELIDEEELETLKIQ